MSDSDHYEELIGGALDEFRHAEALEGAPMGGPAAVRTRVARRRRARLATYGVLGALLIAVPMAAFAAHPRGNNGPPDGRLNANELAGVAAPACGKQVAVDVKEVAHANLDSDPWLETAALLVCGAGDDSTRVVAFDRGTDGRVVSLGVIIGGPGGPADVDVVGVKSRIAGGITATVHRSARIAQLGRPSPQQRDFAWDGSRFVQVGGPAAFVKARSALSLTATPLELGPEHNGKRSGTVTLTVRNTGPEDSQPIDIELSTGHRITVQGYPGNVIAQETVKAGQATTVTLTVTIELESGQTPLGIGAGLHSYADDPDVADNSVQIEVTP